MNNTNSTINSISAQVNSLENTVTDIQTNVNSSIPFINTSRVLYTQSGIKFTYTATENCIVAGTVETSGTAACTIKIDNMRVGGLYSMAGDVTSSVFLTLKKGQTLFVETNRFNNSYPLRIFGLLV